MYQAPPQPPGTLRVLLVFDVPAAQADLPHRTAQLADDFGALIAQTLPGVRARPAVISAGSQVRPAPTPRERRGLTVDLGLRSVRVDGRCVHLTYREFELLGYLLARPSCTVSRADLIRDVWRDRPQAGAHDGSQRTVDTHVRRLRAKLGPYGRMVTTVRGHGYRCDPGPDADVRSA